jgi:hypothetical protein
MPGRQPGVDLRLGQEMQPGELLRPQAQDGGEIVLLPGGGKRLAANSTAS